MESTTYPQCRIVPIRMLQADNAEKFLDGLSCIPGIRRLLVHGPGYQNTPEKPEDYYTSRIPSSTMVKIAEQNVDMHILIGDIIIEALDEKVMIKIADFCKDFFDDLSFCFRQVIFAQGRQQKLTTPLSAIVETYFSILVFCGNSYLTCSK